MLRSERHFSCCELFFEVMSDSGSVSRQEFRFVLNDIAQPESEEECYLLNRVSSRMYDAFDVDHDGTVTFAELCSGLAVLCGGSKAEKIESSFALFDVDGDGVISRDELEVYFTSVFSIVSSLEPSAYRNHGATEPAQLAKETAAEVFEAFDVDQNGELSFDEFKAWYESGEVAPADADEESEGSDAEEEFSLALAREVEPLPPVSPPPDPPFPGRPLEPPPPPPIRMEFSKVISSINKPVNPPPVD